MLNKSAFNKKFHSNRLKVPVGGAIQHFSRIMIPGAMTGAVPRLFSIVPFHLATKMSACGIDTKEPAFLIFI